MSYFGKKSKNRKDCDHLTVISKYRHHSLPLPIYHTKFGEDPIQIKAYI